MEGMMATIMLMRWDGVTPEQYDQLRENVRWDTERPDGAKLHVSGFRDGGIHVLDVWDSEQAFNNFMEQRLGPGVQEVGVQGQPEVEFFPMHGIYAPALGLNSQRSDL
jgi:hypothetical protein